MTQINSADPPAASPPPAPAVSTPPITLNALRWADPLRWLVLGWRDFVRGPGIGLFYGACFVAMGWLLLEVYERAPACD